MTYLTVNNNMGNDKNDVLLCKNKNDRLHEISNNEFDIRAMTRMTYTRQCQTWRIESEQIWRIESEQIWRRIKDVNFIGLDAMKNIYNHKMMKICLVGEWDLKNNKAVGEIQKRTMSAKKPGTSQIICTCKSRGNANQIMKKQSPSSINRVHVHLLTDRCLILVVSYLQVKYS